MKAENLIEILGLTAHAEGGWYRQTWAADNEGRASATAIYFLLAEGERSHWHTVDATEIWLYHSGAPLILRRSESRNGPATRSILGPDLSAGQSPQLVVDAHHWQSAESTGAWSLVSCIVSPGFDFAGFTLAQPGFDIPEG